jgi:hypothetical protein
LNDQFTNKPTKPA